MYDENEKLRSDDQSGVDAELTVVGPPSVDAVEQEPKADATSPSPELEYVPDGGREAWIVVLGTTMALFASAGMINAYVRA